MPESFSAISLQVEPPIFVCGMAGRWLLKRTTPSWRLEDPLEGFQRIVNEARARQIAAAVLDQGRTFPNAIVLATNSSSLELSRGRLTVPDRARFLIVDGQHRLWAQQFSEREAIYACMIHPGLDERQMAKLFVEINDTQKRVPASLRWDLVRLVREDENSEDVRAVDLVFELTTTKGSPLFQRIDLTGETSELSIKQASLAPEIKRLVKARESEFRSIGFDIQYKILSDYLRAVSDMDPEGWREGTSNVYSNRVLRALLRILGDILGHVERPVQSLRALDYATYLELVDVNSLSREAILDKQGSAGISAIYRQIADQIFD